ncbi:MAG: hypothetical protein L0Y66_22255 [Myxococcaceae bacterium]|nr:hypothetical protein [Myxococcaceae bacterium]MCI0669709.1 hypothetical protein [Myxococcaceae bacterium]
MRASRLEEDIEATDMEIPEGCPLCDGPLEVRASPTGAWSYCAHCHWLSPTRLGMGEKGGLLVLHPAALA